MSLSDLAALGSFVSGLAVLVSLVFLFFQMRQMNEQVRQNTKHMSAQMWQAASDRGVNMMMALADPEQAAVHLLSNGKEATPEKIRERQFFLQTFAFYEIAVGEIFQQAAEGLIDPDRLARVRAHTVQILRQDPGSRHLLSVMMTADAARKDPFHDYLKTMIAEAEAAAAAEQSAQPE
jgi:hypothetical protein